MKLKRVVALSGALAILLAGGCTVQQEKPSQIRVEIKQPYNKPAAKPKPQLIKIVGIGYGSESTYQGYTPGQRRLMAIRASKLDAYRALAEQIYGIRIDSNTTVSALMAKNDSFRARVNAVVRGARIVSVTPMADQNYETILEVYVDKNFFRQNFVYTGECGAGGCEPQEVYDAREITCDARMNCTDAGQQP
ncbi:MAG TPA: hypothetical protein EYP05_07995 [Piscirickettsiaceae bacterium]|nr:hypothetical protein [Piscirickettsiaceae bacterium]HIQ39703.1 hypothetical protein [Sulfurivirga caldicuralii]